MKQVMWLLVLTLAAGGLAWLWRGHRMWSERSRAEEARLASFMNEAMMSANRSAVPAPAAAPQPADPIAQQKLLFEAAAKAGEAGEPALAIQLYARLLARYPGTAFAAQARGNVETQKRNLAKA